MIQIMFYKKPTTYFSFEKKEEEPKNMTNKQNTIPLTQIW